MKNLCVKPEMRMLNPDFSDNPVMFNALLAFRAMMEVMDSLQMRMSFMVDLHTDLMCLTGAIGRPVKTFLWTISEFGTNIIPTDESALDERVKVTEYLSRTTDLRWFHWDGITLQEMSGGDALEMIQVLATQGGVR